MSKKKMIITAVVLLAVLLVGGLLAYFTDTDTRTNVFTLGNVNIELQEEGWTGTNDRYTNPEANNITPNKTIAKAPVVKNIGDGTNGNDAYVFLKVELPHGQISGSAEDVYELNNLSTKWTEISNSNGTHIYVYGTGTAKANMTALSYGQSTPAVFESVTLKNVQNPSTLPSDLNIKVTAYGIQTEDLDLTSATGTTEAAKIFSLFN